MFKFWVPNVSARTFTIVFLYIYFYFYFNTIDNYYVTKCCNMEMLFDTQSTYLIIINLFAVNY